MFVKKKNTLSEKISINCIFFISHADHPNADWMFLITIKVFLITLKIKENHLFPLYIHVLNEMLNERGFYKRKKHKIFFVVFDSLITLYILCFIAFVFVQKKSYEKMCNKQSIKDVLLFFYSYSFSIFVNFWPLLSFVM